MPVSYLAGLILTVLAAAALTVWALSQGGLLAPALLLPLGLAAALLVARARR